MLLRLVSKRKCPQLTLLYRSVSKDRSLSFIKKGPDAKFHPLPTFSEVGPNLPDKILRAGTGHYVHVTGQYYDHDPSLTRNVVMRVGTEVMSDFKPRLIMDAALTDSEIKVLTNLLVDSKQCRHVSVGEVDCVGSEDWNYGYVLSPSFTVFSRAGIVLQQNIKNKTLLQLHSRPGYLIAQKIWMKDIETVFVHLTPRPWSTQKFGVRLLHEQIDVLKHTREDAGPIVDQSAEPSHDELGEIMINTEWIVKAAAQLVYVVSQNRYKNATIPLYVPKIIQADINPWVEMRNSMWHGELVDKLESSRKGYIP